MVEDLFCILFMYLFDFTLGFKISGNNWVLESGRKYEITVQLFDHTNHQLFMFEVSI